MRGTQGGGRGGALGCRQGGALRAVCVCATSLPLGRGWALNFHGQGIHIHIHSAPTSCAIGDEQQQQQQRTAAAINGRADAAPGRLHRPCSALPSCRHAAAGAVVPAPPAGCQPGKDMGGALWQGRGGRCSGALVVVVEGWGGGAACISLAGCVGAGGRGAAARTCALHWTAGGQMHACRCVQEVANIQMPQRHTSFGNRMC